MDGFTPKPLVLVLIPSDGPEQDAELNHKFCAVWDHLYKSDVIAPVLPTVFMQRLCGAYVSEEKELEYTLSLLPKCDAVFSCYQKTSISPVLEAAEKYGIPIFSGGVSGGNLTSRSYVSGTIDLEAWAAAKVREREISSCCGEKDETGVSCFGGVVA